MAPLKCPNCGVEPIEPQDFEPMAAMDRLSAEEKKKYFIIVEQVFISKEPKLQVRGVCPECRKYFYGIFELESVEKEPLEEV